MLSYNVSMKRQWKGITTTYLLESDTPILVLYRKQKALNKYILCHYGNTSLFAIASAWPERGLHIILKLTQPL